ncbi:MAG TPA: hypothetical protein VIC55_07225 [Gemmatimonadaceae bacterium]
MARLTSAQYDALERAIAAGQRIAIQRRGTEYVVVPARLRTSGRHEVIEAVHPTTGERMEFLLDDLDDIQVVR